MRLKPRRRAPRLLARRSSSSASSRLPLRPADQLVRSRRATSSTSGARRWRRCGPSATAPRRASSAPRASTSSRGTLGASATCARASTSSSSRAPPELAAPARRAALTRFAASSSVYVSTRGRSSRRRRPARAGAEDVPARRRPLPVGASGRDRAGAVRRRRRAVPDDLLPHVPLTWSLPSRGSRRRAGSSAGAPRSRTTPACGTTLERATEEQVRIRRELAAGETGTDDGASLDSRDRRLAESGGAEVPPRTRRLRARPTRVRLGERALAELPERWPRDLLQRPSLAVTTVSQRAPASGTTGTRRFLAAAREPGQADALHRQRDAVLEELRRRVGGVYTLAELVEAYDGAERWLQRGRRRARAARRGWARTVALVSDAAFYDYSRRRPGLRTVTIDPPRAARRRPREAPWPCACCAHRRRRRRSFRARGRARAGARRPPGTRRHADLRPHARAAAAAGALVVRGRPTARLSLELLGGLEQARDDHADRGRERDPDADPAAGEEEVVRDGDDADRGRRSSRARRARP